MVMATATHWTADMVRALPDDGNRYEVVDGVLLVTPSPAGRHQMAITWLFGALWDYLGPLGRRNTLVMSPADISWAPDVLTQPDLFVMARPMAHGWPEVKDLLLAIEVLSPGSQRADRVIKRQTYQKYGVATYWVVDHEAARVEVWHPGDPAAEIVTGTLSWQASPEAPSLVIDLPALFARLPGPA